MVEARAMDEFDLEADAACVLDAGLLEGFSVAAQLQLPAPGARGLV